MKIDNEINDLLLDLEKDLTKIMDNKGTKEIKKVYEEEVDYAYDEFQPISYQRRYKRGGFADENNWETEVDLTKNGIEFTLTNEAKAVNSSLRLDKIIEEGVYYDWKGVNPSERPVYQRVQERIEDEQVVENILESELRKLGYDFK